MANAQPIEGIDTAGVSPTLEEQRRKRALDIIKKAVRNSVIPLNNREVGHRVLPGVWSATVNILLACLDVKDVIKLLTNRAASLAHVADNSEIPAVTLHGAKLSRYIEEVAVAGQAIAETIDAAIPQLEKEDLEDRLPESVLDCAIFLLVNSWGPFHLRRAMVEQVSTFLAGRAAPALFMEPVEQIKMKPDHDVVIEQAADVKPAEAPPMPPRGEKLVRAFSDYRLEGTRGEWSVAIHKSGPGNAEELHVLKGETNDANGRATPLAAVVEALKSVSHENPATVVFVETCHAFVLKGMDGQGDEKLAFRHPEEASLWREFDALVYGRDIRFRAVSANLSEPLQHTCDMVMKRGVVKLV